MWPPYETGRRLGRQRVLSLVLTLAGVALLVWLVNGAGRAGLVSQLRALGPIFPFLLILTGIRYGLQAAGWRLAMEAADRPGWRASLRGVVAGEAVGYLAWAGPVAREPIKAMFVRERVPMHVALSAAIAERVAYTVAAALLVVLALAIVALATGHARWVVTGTTAVVAAGLAVWGRRGGRVSGAPPHGRMARRTRSRPAPATEPHGREGMWAAMRHTTRTLWRSRRFALLGILGLGVGQEILSVLEAYTILVWLGAAPTLGAVLVFEGATKLVNAAGWLVPGRVGVAEVASAALAEALRLGSTQGVTLALTRRARSLVWGAAGVAILGYRAFRHSPVRPARAEAAGTGRLLTGSRSATPEMRIAGV